jgi:hypothetical protein
VGKPDSRGTFEAIRDAYEHLDAQSVALYKLGNLKTLVGPAPAAWHGGAARVAQREYIWNAIGIFNIGWIVALIQLLRRRRLAHVPYAGAMIGAAMISLFVWCVMLFGPAQTFTEHGSYADILLLSLGLLGFVLELPPVVLIALLTLQTANLLLVWVAFRPASFTLPSRAVVAPELQWPMLILATALGAAGFWHFGRSYFRRKDQLTAPFADALLKKEP